MLLPSAFYPHAECIAKHLPHLRPSQVKGLALWVGATILARSSCQNAVLGALQSLGLGWHTTRQYLREWLRDGADRAAPCRVPRDVQACCAPLLRWVLAWWQGTELTLAVAPTAKGGERVALVVSVVYRGLAIPVAWRIKTGGQLGPWIADLCDLRDCLGPVVPPHMTVRVLCDRGLQSPRLWAAIRRQGWHPYLRYDRHMTFQATTGPRWPAWRFVAREGQYTVTAGKAFRERKRCCTLIVLWVPGQDHPWVVLTDEAPDTVDLGAYGLRVWIEQGFRTLKRRGWQWHRTRRLDPARVDRHGLVLAVATLWVPATARAWRRPACAAWPPGGCADRPRSPPPPEPAPEPVSAGLVPGPAAAAPRPCLGPGLAAAPAGTGPARRNAAGGPAHRVASFWYKDADWGFTYPYQGIGRAAWRRCAVGARAVRASPPF